MDEISTLAQLNALDQDAITEGYRHALNGTPNHTRRDQAYWHWYGNAHSDRNKYSTPAQQKLAREYVESLRNARVVS